MADPRETNLWSKLNSTWRELRDSATISWSVSKTAGGVDIAQGGVVDGSIGTTQLANDSVTYAKMQNISASPRILGRKTAGAGDPEECTLSEVLDFIGSAAQGDILYRGSSTWTRLGAGTNLQFLQTQGVSANPQYAFSGLTLLNSGTVSAVATLDIVLTNYTAFRGLRFELSGFRPATDDVELWTRFSTNGGSSYDATGYNYSALWLDSDGAGGALALRSGSANQISMSGNVANYAVGNGTAEGINITVTLMNQTSSAFWSRIIYQAYYIDANATPNAITINGGGAREAAQDTDAIRFLFESGNITSGNWAIYGLA